MAWRSIPRSWRCGTACRPRLARPRVMYVSTAYYGFHQVYPPVSRSAPLYFDWQIRLLELLKSFPIDLTCKPHPEGLFADPPMLAPYAAVNDVRFETALVGADVLVYDYPASTTLSVGLCSDRPIVLIDHGSMRFNESIRPHIEKRCRIVRAEFDLRNRLVVSRNELAHAICGDLAPADPSYFRDLFLGGGLQARDAHMNSMEGESAQCYIDIRAQYGWRRYARGNTELWFKCYGVGVGSETIFDNDF